MSAAVQQPTGTAIPYLGSGGARIAAGYSLGHADPDNVGLHARRHLRPRAGSIVASRLSQLFPALVAI